jgi:Ribbon-helix-helix protein, copG family.
MTTVVQVRMKENTIKQVDKLQKRTHSPSRSDAVRRAVEISDTIISAIEHGEKVIIESKNGKQRQILVTGLSK